MFIEEHLIGMSIVMGQRFDRSVGRRTLMCLPGTGVRLPERVKGYFVLFFIILKTTNRKRHLEKTDKCPKYLVKIIYTIYDEKKERPIFPFLNGLGSFFERMFENKNEFFP